MWRQLLITSPLLPLHNALRLVAACACGAGCAMLWFCWHRRMLVLGEHSSLQASDDRGEKAWNSWTTWHKSTGGRTVQRKTICADALEWLQSEGTMCASVITSLPDVTELSYLRMSTDDYRTWFVATAKEILSRAPHDAIIIFYQTDFRVRGEWVDKSALCSMAAREENARLLFHKIICTAPPDSFQSDKPRPRYSHLVAYSKGLRDSMRESTADVLSDRGLMTWERAMGVRACELACRYILQHAPPTRQVVLDPFCGHGTILAVANSLGMDSVGVERNKDRCRVARNLELQV